MAETASSVNIQDIPEYLKPYRTALLNSAYRQVFTPEYLQQQIPGATFSAYPSGQQQAQPQQPLPNPQPPDQEQNPYPYYGSPAINAAYDVISDQPVNRVDRSASGGNTLALAARGIEEAIARGDFSGRRGYASGGRLASAAEEIERMLSNLGSSTSPISAPAGSDVYLTPGGSPLGVRYPAVTMPSPVLPGTVGTGVQTPPAPVTPPISNLPSNPIINTPPSGTLPVINPNPGPQGPGQGQPGPGSGQGQPPPGQSPAGLPMFTASMPSNFAGAAQASAMGYNPAQYADDTVAAQLAREMGGQQSYTQTTGPIGPPSQAMLDFGGTEQHNAGLIADIGKRFADDPGMRQFALDNLRKEIQSYGGTTTGQPSFREPSRESEADQILRSNGSDMMGRSANYVPGQGAGRGAGDQMARLNGYKSGGPIRFAGGSGVDLLGAGQNTATTPTPNPLGGGALNPYQPYGQQRIVGMGGNFGQQGANGTLQASDLTRNSLQGYSNLPSYFNQYGEINHGYDNSGNSTTPFGVAEDIFDTSGKLAINASQNAQDMSWRSPLSSSYGSFLSGLQQNPEMFSAGDVTVGQLTAPQMDQPLGVGAAQLNAFQTAGPRTIDTSSANIGYGRFIDPGTPEAYMTPYMTNALDVQKKRATQDFNNQKSTRDANAVRAGAFGGSRQAVADSMAGRDLNDSLQRIDAMGMQSAYENAQQQFERERQASLGSQQFNVGQGMQGQLANQAALQRSNETNLAALLGVQELGANQYLQSQLANQQAGLTAGQANLGSALSTQNLARTSGLQAAQGNQNTRLSQNQSLLDAFARADQLKQQADQGNFTNQLSAMGQQTNSALAANNIGQSRADLPRLAQAMELQKLQAQGTAGAGIDARTQSALDLGYQDYINQQNYPYQQLNWLQGMLSGVPMGYNQEQVMFNRNNMMGQVAGLGTAGLGALGSYLGSK